MLKEFAAKKCVKLGKLLEKGGIAVDNKKKLPGGSSQSENCTPVKVNQFQFGDVLFFSYYCADFNFFCLLTNPFRIILMITSIKSHFIFAKTIHLVNPLVRIRSSISNKISPSIRYIFIKIN